MRILITLLMLLMVSSGSMVAAQTNPKVAENKEDGQSDFTVQNEAKMRRFGWGFKIGANIADYTGSRGTPKVGAYGGVYLDVNFGRLMGMEIGAFYSEQGSKANVEVGYPQSIHRLDYISVPVLFKYYLIPRFRLFLGPQVEVLLTAKRQWKNSEGAWEVSRMQGVAKYDLGIVAGVGYTFGFGLDLGVSYTQGFGNLKINSQPNRTTLTRVSVGWRF